MQDISINWNKYPKTFKFLLYKSFHNFICYQKCPCNSIRPYHLYNRCPSTKKLREFIKELFKLEKIKNLRNQIIE